MAENEELITYIKRAFELRNQECYKQAIEMLYKAIAIEPDNIELLYQIGEMYYLLGNYTRAIQYPEKILSQDENHTGALRLLKNIYLKQNELFSAKETAEKLYSIEPEEKNLSSLIKILGKLEMYEETEVYSSEIETSAKCLYELAKAYYNSGRKEKAEEFIIKIEKIDQNNEDCLILKGKILYDKNEQEKSREIFEKISSNSQSPEVLNYKGLFAMEDLNFIDAIKFFSKAITLKKNNPQYAYNLANAYFLNGWYDEAVSSYKNAIYLSPDNTEYRYSLAYAYLENGETDKAKQESDTVLKINPKHTGANVIRALIMFKNKNYIEAEKILLSNITDKADDEFTLSSLAKIEIELAKYDSAEKHIKSVLDNNPQNISYILVLGNIYTAAKKYEEAISLANQIISLNENYIDGYILGAKSSFLSGKYEECKNFAQTVLSIDINCAEGYYYLALTRLKEEDYEEAVECMRRAILYDVNNPEYYAKMAEIYSLKGDNKTAFDYIKEAESINDSEAYRILYKKYAALNRK